MSSKLDEYKEWVYETETIESRLKIYRRYFSHTSGISWKSHFLVNGIEVDKLGFAKFLYKKENIIAIQLDCNVHFTENYSYMIVHRKIFDGQDEDIYGFKRDINEIIEYQRELKFYLLIDN